MLGWISPMSQTNSVSPLTSDANPSNTTTPQSINNSKGSKGFTSSANTTTTWFPAGNGNNGSSGTSSSASSTSEYGLSPKYLSDILSTRTNRGDGVIMTSAKPGWGGDKVKQLVQSQIPSYRPPQDDSALLNNIEQLVRLQMGQMPSTVEQPHHYQADFGPRSRVATYNRPGNGHQRGGGGGGQYQQQYQQPQQQYQQQQQQQYQQQQQQQQQFRGNVVRQPQNAVAQLHRNVSAHELAQIGSSSRPMNIRTKFGSLGSTEGQFNSPHGFCLGAMEQIIVADTDNHRIQVFSKDGEYQGGFGIPGKDEGKLWFPRKVAVIKQTGLFIICDRGNERSRMQVFDRYGNFVRRIPIRYIDIVAGLAINRFGMVVAVDSVTPTVFVINPNTGNRERFFDCSSKKKKLF